METGDAVCNFTGRGEYLEKIHAQLKECCDKKEWQDRTVVLHGIGGIGKTELVRQYVKNHAKVPAEEKLFESVVWINANTKESATASFTELAQKYNFSEGMNLESAAKKFYRCYSRNIKTIKNCLLIFDNAEQSKDETYCFGIYKILPISLPPKSKIPLMLITSRYGKWDFPPQNTIQIKELSFQESVTFLKAEFQLNGAQTEDNENETLTAIGNLAEEIQHYPFALSLAASNIDKTNLIEEIQKYITELKIPNSGWIHHENKLGSYNFTMKNVWDSTFGILESMKPEGECALQLLLLLSYLPVNFLCTARIEKIAKFCFGDDKDFSQGFKTLEKYSFITTSEREREKLIEINRHVQRCIREKLDSCGNFSYLFAICLFFCTQDMHSFDQSDFIILAMHNLLKERNWPHDSISLSIRFISHSVKQDDFQIFNDVNNWFKKQTNSNTLNKRILLLLDVWCFYFSHENKYSGEVEFPGPFSNTSCQHDSCATFTELFVEELKLLVVRTGQDGSVIDLNESPFYPRDRLEFLEFTPTALAENKSRPNYSFPIIRFKHPLKKEEGNRALCSNVNLMKDEESKLESGAQDSLQAFELSPPSIVGKHFIAKRWFKLMDHCFMELKEDAKEKVCEIVLSALKSFSTNLEINDILKNTELFCKCIRAIGFEYKSVLWLTDTVIKTHMAFYPNLKDVDHSTFWNMHFHLYETIVSYWVKLDADPKKCVADKFFFAGGLQLFIHHLRSVNSSSSFTTEFQTDSFSKKLFDLFGSIILLASKPIGAEKFVETKDFLEILNKVIKIAFSSSDNTKRYIDRKFLCLLSWLAFFDENETFLRTPEPKWLLNSLKTEMGFFEKDLEQETGFRLENTLAKIALKIIAKILLSEFNEFHDIANGLYKHLQCIADPEIFAFKETVKTGEVENLLSL